MIYLDNAATSYPKPSEIYEKTIRFMKESGGNPGRGSHAVSNAAAAMIEDTRRDVARFFGLTDFRRVIFTANCTDSINMVLKGYLRRGDHVIATNLDHNSISRPLEGLKQRSEISVTRVPFEGAGEISMENIAGSIRNNTKLIVLTHGSNVLGSIQPLNPVIELAAARNIPVLLDAAQTAGRVTISLKTSSVFLACSGHKGLFGMPGLGILTVPEGLDLERWREGGSGSASESLEHPAEYPARLEAGTPNVTGIASLYYALKFLNATKISEIHIRERELALRLEKALAGDSRFTVFSARSGEHRLGVCSLNVRGVSPQEVSAILDQSFGIAVRAGLHCAAVLHAQLGTLPEGCIRVSPGWFNTEQEIDTLINALMQIAASYVGAQPLL